MGRIFQKQQLKSKITVTETDIRETAVITRVCKHCKQPLPENCRANMESHSACKTRAYREARIDKQIARHKKEIFAACDFAEKNPDIVERIAMWIKWDVQLGPVSNFRYYWELYIREREKEGRSVKLNNNWESTIKTLITNRYPELDAAIKTRTK